MKFLKPFAAIIFLFVALPGINCTADYALSSPVEDMLTRSHWLVEHFQNRNLPVNYENYRIDFDKKGTLTVKKDSGITNGSWSKSFNSSNQEVISINLFTTDALLMELNKEWKISSRSSVNVSFEVLDAAGTTSRLTIRRDE